MKFSIDPALLLLVVTVMHTSRVQAQDTTTPNRSSSPKQETVLQEPAEGQQSDWDAIRRSVEDYAAAFNSHSAQAIADLYTENAELVDTGGNAYRGRDVIAAEYAAFFQAHPHAKLQIFVENLTFVSPTVAIEDGRTESRLADDQSPSSSRYVAVHVKEGDRWRLASVRDHAMPAEASDKLDELSWLIGRWVDESPEGRLQIDCYWHESGSYLMRDFEITIEGLLASSGSERIGWDPIRKQVRSWLFDSAGGYLDAAWLRNGDHWTVTARGFRADGQPTQATYVVTPLRDDAYHMQSFDRTAGERDLDDFEMTIVRRPPAPGEIPALKAPADKKTAPEEKKE